MCARASNGRPGTPAATPTTSGSSPSPRHSAWTTSGRLQRQARPTSAKTASRKLYRRSTDRPTLTIRWHLIGTLQSNKVRKAVPRFSAIHSVDSRRLLDAIDAAATDAGTTPELLVQVDLGREATKHGAPQAEAMDIVRAAASCRSARCVGLMTIPPLFDNPEDTRPYFATLRALRDALLNEGLDRAMLRELSMGMSHDFEIAVQEGATIVRLGTAIFGKRHV